MFDVGKVFDSITPGSWPHVALILLCALSLIVAGSAALLRIPPVREAFWAAMERLVAHYTKPGRSVENNLAAAVAGVQRGLDTLLEQAVPNGGDTKSLGDRVVRIESGIQRIIQHIDMNHAVSRALANRIGAMMWLSDTEGEADWLSEPLCDLMGFAPQQAMGSGWKAAVFPEDAQRVYREWSQAVEERRRFCSDYRIRHVKGEVFAVTGIADPVISSTGDVVGFVGNLTRRDKG